MRSIAGAAVLVLAACGGNGSGVTLTLVNRPATPATYQFVVVYQDGDGPWLAAPPPHGDDYALPIKSPRYAVAWTCPSSVTSIYTTVAEQDHVTAHVADDCTDPGPMVTLSGTLMLYNVAGKPVVAFGDRYAIATGDLPYTFQLSVPPGTHDLVATVGGCDMHQNSCAATEAIVLRGVDAHAAVAFGEMPNANVQSVPTVQATSVNADTVLYTAGGTSVGLASVDTNQGFQTRSLDPTQARPGDIYEHITHVAGVTHEEWTTATGAFTPQASSPAATGATASRNGTIAISWSAPAADSYTWSAIGLPDTGMQQWSGTVSQGYVAGSFMVRMPDLSQVTGWNPALALDGMATGDVAAQITTHGTPTAPWSYPAPDGTIRDRIAATWTLAP